MTDAQPQDAAPTDEAPAEEALTGPTFVFVDCEATGLDLTRCQLTEVSWVVRRPDGSTDERRYFPEHTLDGADEQALEITHYHERIAPQPTSPREEWLPRFLEDADGAFLVGAVPDFDARAIAEACRQAGVEPTWDHHLIDVETLALPLIAGEPEGPRSLARTCEALGVAHDKDQAHGALYDAKQAMRAFDAIWDRLADLRRRRAPLPPPVPRRPRQTEEPTTDRHDTEQHDTDRHDTEQHGAARSSAEPRRTTAA